MSEGRITRKTKDCAICGTTFVPSSSKKHKTCCKKCLSEIGRRNARKRWDARTDCKPHISSPAQEGS